MNKKIISITQEWLGGTYIGGVLRETVVSGKTTMADLRRMGCSCYTPMFPERPASEGYARFEVQEDGTLLFLDHTPDTSD